MDCVSITMKHALLWVYGLAYHWFWSIVVFVDPRLRVTAIMASLAAKAPAVIYDTLWPMMSLLVHCVVQVLQPF